jgi:hypothetical protein
MSSLLLLRLPRLLPRLIHLALLASLGVLALLPAFDHHAAEYSPWHSHLLAGGRAVVGMPEHHAHPYTQPHTHPAAPGDPALAEASGVIFGPNPLAGVVSLLAALDQAIPPGLTPLALPAVALWLLCALGQLWPRAIQTPLPDPPPRLRRD